MLSAVIASLAFSQGVAIATLPSEFDRQASFKEGVVQELSSFPSAPPFVHWVDAKRVYGLPEGQIRFLASEVSALMVSEALDFRAGLDTVDIISRRIGEGVERVLTKFQLDSKSTLAKRLIAGGVCDWVRTHVVYNSNLADQGPGMNKIRPWARQSENMMSMPQMYAVCSGYSQLVYDLGRKLGLEVYQVDGWIQKPTLASYPKEVEHTWVLFRFSNGAQSVSVVSCPSASSVSLAQARQLKGDIGSPLSLPLSFLESQLAAWKYVPSQIIESKPMNAAKAKVIEQLDSEQITRWMAASSSRRAPERLLGWVNRNQTSSRVRISLPNLGD